MSYDVYLIPKESPETLTEQERDESIVCGNYTFNVFKMLSKAFGCDDWKYIDGMKARIALKHIHNAIESMAYYPEMYEAMNPKNGWGSYSGALNWLTKIYSKCTKYPEYYIFISC